MEEMIGYSAYNLFENAYEYSENECFVADSIESLSDFIKGAGFSLEDFRAVKVCMSDILKDYAVSCGRYCMEPEALKRFEKQAHSCGVPYSLEAYCKGLVNVEVDLPPEAYEPERRDSNAGLAPKIQKEEIPTLVNLSSQKNWFLLLKQLCVNPSSPSNNIVITLVEVDERLKPVKNPLSFTIWLDLDTGKEINPPERPEGVGRLVEEFLNELTEKMKADLLSEVRSYKKDEERLAECELDPHNVIEGILVSYTDIVSYEGSITHGGRFVSFRFLHNGREYLVEDLYCPNPECQCEKVHLQFFELTREFSGSASICDCFMAEMTFKGRMQVYEQFKYNAQDAKDLMRAWKDLYPGVLDVLKDRYEKIKRIGEGSLQGKGFFKIPESSPRPVTPKRKIGRNEPCPCGSGKKYKKCCGAG